MRLVALTQSFALFLSHNHLPCFSFSLARLLSLSCVRALSLSLSCVCVRHLFISLARSPLLSLFVSFLFVSRILFRSRALGVWGPG